jgi:hypothetical protein
MYLAQKEKPEHFSVGIEQNRHQTCLSLVVLITASVLSLLHFPLLWLTWGQMENGFVTEHYI